MRQFLILFLAIAIPFISVARDFSVYTTIDADIKAVQRLNWQNNFSGTSGNVAVFGNSITYTMAFWAPFQWATVVPGTNASSYGNKNCAYSGYEITDGLNCIENALSTLTPEVAICMYGTNDVNDKTIGSYPANLRTEIRYVSCHSMILQDNA